ncbi:MAG: tetratricopeptide repeat protein [Alphaproteobacteria bacterium]
MKKRKRIYPILGALIGVALIAGYLKNPIQLPDFKKDDLWVSRRPLPDVIAVNTYLAGNSARANQDLSKAVAAYADVLQKDPNNVSLLEETYLLAMIQGNPEAVLPYLNHLNGNKMLADYARVVQHFQKNQLEEALSLLKHKPAQGADEVLLPLVKAWLYVAQGEEEKALHEIDTLKDSPFLKGYQQVLLGTHFKDDALIQSGITQMGDHPILAIGYFPLLQETITQTGNWETSALYKKYQELTGVYPATADLLVQVGQKEITPTKGLAESFYVVSALGGNGHFTREESMAANTLALFLDPEKQMSFVWGAELAEGLHLPTVALSYYDRLNFHSATLDFKRSASLMLANQTEKALDVLERLEKTNKTSIPLLTLLGQAYQETNQNERALAVYNRLIPLLEAGSKNEPLIQAYVTRGLLYGATDSEKMLDDLKRAHALAPENAMLLNDLGYHQLENGHIEEGFDLIQQAYQKKPHDPYILDSLAVGYWKKGQASVALPLAERALDLMPQSALINTHLGDIYAALGRHREARFQFKKALDLKTDLTPKLAEELTQKLKGE